MHTYTVKANVENIGKWYNRANLTQHAYEYTNNLKQTEDNKIDSLEIKKINNVTQIPKPKSFELNAFPKEVLKTIDKNSNYVVCYDFVLSDKNKNIKRKITIFFITEKEYAALKPGDSYFYEGKEYKKQ